jgi:nucleotide-binding universal stress UspA family protein
MRIVIAIDNSKYSQQALEALIQQVSPQKAEVLVLHVVEPTLISSPPQMAAGYAPELGQDLIEARELVEKTAKKLRIEGFKVDTSVQTGDVRETIADIAAQWGADLIVVGSHGRKGIRRFLLGSVAESVARHAPCSVEIVRAGNI